VNPTRVTTVLAGLIAAVAVAAAAGLADTATASASPAAAATTATIVRAMAKADSYWLAHGVSPDGATWQNSTFQIGNLAYRRMAGARPNLATQIWARHNDYAVDSSTGPARPDDLAAGEVYLMLGHPASIRARVAGEVAAGNHTLWGYVDALNMAMPSYARLGVLDKSAADLDAMQSQFTYTEKTLGLFNPATGLWWRDAGYKGTDTYWSRGNGWAMMALAKVLQILPAGDPRYRGYLQVFDQMAAALVPRQLSDGFWGADLRKPSAYGYEESGTAFFTYAMAWGISAGILDPTIYRPVVTRAWRALSTIALQPSGEVGYVQGATAGAFQPSDGQPVQVTDTAGYGVGGFLLAGSEMAQIGHPPSRRQIKAALSRVLRPAGRTARIEAIVRDRGYTLWFRSPSAGRLVIAWYARVQGRRALIAAARVVFPQPDRAAVKLMLTGRGVALLQAGQRLTITTDASFTPGGATATSSMRTTTLTR
jgi:unsaturated rhamnogalacturonyl hydrolase